MDGVTLATAVEIELDGRLLEPAAVAEALVAVTVRQRLSTPTQAELRLWRTDAIATRFAVGQRLRLVIEGSDGLFQGEVTAVEHVFAAGGERTVLVRSYDLLHRLQKRTAVRAHVQVTLGDLARQLVADLGVTVDALESGPIWQRVIQHGQTDWAVLRRLTERSGLYLALHGERLQVVSLAGADEVAARLRLGRELLEARVAVNGAGVCDAVAVNGWNPATGHQYAGAASDSRAGRTTGPRPSADHIGATAERTRVQRVIEDDEQAEAMARAELDARTAALVTVHGVAEGAVELRPGVAVDVEGLGAELDGRYVLTEAVHRLDARLGYITEIGTLPPPSAHAASNDRWAAADGVRMLLAEVQRIDDPQGLGRVQVSLLNCGNVEAEWMGVVVPGAGAGKGMLAMPEVGDTVVVLSAGDDPGQGVVLGGLYGQSGLPTDAEIASGSGAARPFVLLTPGGQRIRVDDATQTIRLQTSTGHVVEMSPEGLKLSATADVTIEAPGRTVTIRGSAINLDRA